MLTPEQNERLTRVGPGTPMGEVFRRSWLPAVESAALPEPDGPPIRVRLLGEDLIAFRDTGGRVGLVGAYCPHRRAPLFFGRNEENGLRCVYHGWKFDALGSCVDMPSEPPDSLFKQKVMLEAYPTWEAGGIVWAYLGPQDRVPPRPDYEWLRAPSACRHVSTTFEECNWLQALEGGLDTAHSSFLHRRISAERSLRADAAPRLDVIKTEYGFLYAGIRSAGDRDYVRVYQYIMPAQQCRGYVTGNDRDHVPTIEGHFWIPIDDAATTVWNWMYAYDPETPLTDAFVNASETFRGRGPNDLIPGTNKLKRNRENDYLIDRQMQKTTNFTGITGINTQDIALQEAMGPFCDRSKEHLGTTDRAIIAARQLLLEDVATVASGGSPRGLDPATYRNVRAGDKLIPKGADWLEAMRSELRARF